MNKPEAMSLYKGLCQEQGKYIYILYIIIIIIINQALI